MTRGRARWNLTWAVAAVSFALFWYSIPGEAMGKHYLFSEVEGTVLSNGQPVAGARVTRETNWRWKDKTFNEEVTTGADGTFRFPELARSSLITSLLPHEPYITQTILIHHGGRSYDAWLNSKRNYDRNSELGGRPIRVVCSLESEKKKTGDVFGICDVL